ncbi:site-specific integrase [Stenotrophomonas maltophilia]|uniref:site-specific integrase n=1 Tax=Stenotrophomonas maltophilia TaxID=40324 RepID=UPI001ECE65A4|nr:tyrosine-type recombinase/integrase [Stenotrophomonas maltophilia]MBN5137741.1 tyrosine-type recombinase/integrase [Stenotrophomonas maltophilia]MDG2508610.1 tyrosine-type recombinase/integrase [Stenotrophomonas maltophilia]
MAKGKGQLTARGLAALATGEWANDAATHGAGVLQARKLASGAISFYYRYTGPNRKQDRLPLGSTLTLAEARAEAARLARRYQAGERDLRGALLADEAAATRDVALAKAAASARSAATLGALMNAYVSSLKEAGKISAGNVEKAVTLHIEKAWPTLWERPAAEIELDDLIPVLARLVRIKKLREAGKIRSYLRAAYAAAIRAKQDAAAPDSLRAVNLSRNPAQDLATVDSGTPREHALSVAELRAYWRRIAVLPGARGAMLRFHLLIGAQRISQMARLVATDIDHDHQSIRILDIKGRRKRPRAHVVPLIPQAMAALLTMQGEKDGAFLFTINDGVNAVTYDVFRGSLDRVVDAMDAAGELDGPRFTPGDLRRTVETRLAAAGYSEEVRGHVQSHGLSGVQKRHYNKYEYDAEKRGAITALYNLLSGDGAEILRMRVLTAG